MKRASAIVTDHGGRTSHAAIVSCELGIPAIVGFGDATRQLSDGEAVIRYRVPKAIAVVPVLETVAEAESSRLSGSV